MTTREDYITAVRYMVKGELPLGEPEIIMAISQALKEHSQIHPRLVSEDESGTGSFDYAVTLFAEWSQGYSVIKKVEYPVDDSTPSNSPLQDDAWTIYAKPAGKFLRFLEDIPAAGQSFRVTYSALHAVTDAASTVDAFDDEAVQALAASYFCSMISTYFAQTQDSTIQADSVDHKNKSRDYEARAKAYRKMYFDHMGIADGETVPASVTRDQDMRPSWQTDKITHPRKFR